MRGGERFSCPRRTLDEEIAAVECADRLDRAGEGVLIAVNEGCTSFASSQGRQMALEDSFHGSMLPGFYPHPIRKAVDAAPQYFVADRTRRHQRQFVRQRAP